MDQQNGAASETKNVGRNGADEDAIIRLVDLRDYTDGSLQQRKHFVEMVGTSLREIGFFVLQGHGVDKKLIDAAYDICRRFFSLPNSIKAKYDLPHLHGQRGFTTFGKEHAKDHDAPDLKEFWHVGRGVSEAKSSGGHALGTKLTDLWPAEVPEFKQVFTELYAKMDECSMLLLAACSEFLAENSDFLPQMARGGESILRVIHYPPLPKGRDPRSVRAAAHEDINLITLLPESTASGLELLNRAGRWQEVRAQSGHIIVDAGDMLQNLTNGYFRSTTHRVVNPDDEGSTRFSMPFFVHPRSEVDLAPMKSLSSAGEKYPRISAGEYLHQRLAEIGLAKKS